MQPTRIRSSGIDSQITLSNLTVSGNTVLGNTFVGNLFYANGAVFVSGSGAIGFTGSAGAVGFTGSNGPAGSTGFTGSQGTGYTGSQGLIGYTGSAGGGGSGNGYTGSQGDPYLVAIGDAPPNSPVTGTLWWDSSYGSLFFYYTDSDSSQWVNAIGGGGGIGLSTRTTANITTSNIANNVTANVAITGFKGYNLYKIYASHPAWIRLYTSDSARTADSARSQGADPTPDTGVVAEVITSNVAQTVVLSPAVAGFNDESPVTTTIPVAVTNLSGGANAITISVTVLQTEA